MAIKKGASGALRGGVVELGDTTVSKTVGANTPSEFETQHPHQN